MDEEQKIFNSQNLITDVIKAAGSSSPQQQADQSTALREELIRKRGRTVDALIEQKIDSDHKSITLTN